MKRYEMHRAMRQPLPSGFAPETLTLDGGPFGAFKQSCALSDDARILAHCAQHPTVYLPSHDPGSAERLADATTVSQSSAPSSLPRCGHARQHMEVLHQLSYVGTAVRS